MVFKSTDHAITFASGKAGGRLSGWSWRRVALVLVLVAGSMLASAAGSAASTSPTAAATALRARSLPATQVHRVSPLTPSGHLRPGYHVTKHHPARCFGHSFLNGQAYHCENGVDGHQYDPCWKFSARSVVCLQTPWDRTLVRLHLKRIGPGSGPRAWLPRPSNVPPRSWGVQLGAGLGWRCERPGDVVPGLGTHHISYVCNVPNHWDASRPRGWVLVDELNRDPSTWTILSAKLSAAPRATFQFELGGRKPVVANWLPVVR